MILNALGAGRLLCREGDPVRTEPAFTDDRGYDYLAVYSERFTDPVAYLTADSLARYVQGVA